MLKRGASVPELCHLRGIPPQALWALALAAARNTHPAISSSAEAASSGTETDLHQAESGLGRDSPDATGGFRSFQASSAGPVG